MRIVPSLALASLFVSSFGCASPSVTRGSDDASVDELAISRKLDLKDVDIALTKLLADLDESGFAQRTRRSEEQPRLAIMDIRNETDQYGIDTTNLRETFEELVLDMGCFRIVSAADTNRLKEYMAEQTSDWYDGATVPDAGNLFGFSYIIGGVLMSETERDSRQARTQYRLHLKAVDVATGELLWKKSADITKLES